MCLWYQIMLVTKTYYFAKTFDLIITWNFQLYLAVLLPRKGLNPDLFNFYQSWNFGSNPQGINCNICHVMLVTVMKFGDRVKSYREQTQGGGNISPIPRPLWFDNFLFYLNQRQILSQRLMSGSFVLYHWKRTGTKTFSS